MRHLVIAAILSSVCFGEGQQSHHAFTSTINADELIALIQDNKLKSLEATLDLLAQHDQLGKIQTKEQEEAFRGTGSIFANPIFVGVSGGLHQVDPKRARVVLANSAKTFSMAYSTFEGDPRYNILEIAQSPKVFRSIDGMAEQNGDGTYFTNRVHWPRDSKVHGAIQILFPADGRADVQFLLPKAGEVSADPQCLACHKQAETSQGKEFLKKFEEYDFWPGMLGGGRIGTQSAAIDDTIEKSLIERKSHPRLKHFFLNGRLQRADVNVFGKQLFFQNHARIAEELSKDKAYKAFMRAILGAFLGCENIEAFFPVDLATRGPSLQEIRKSTQDAFMKSYKHKAKMAGETIDRIGHLEFKEALSQRWATARYVIEAKMGHSMDSWSLANERDSLEFDSGYLTSLFLLRTVCKDLAIDSTSFTLFDSKLNFVPGDKKLCASLAIESANAIGIYHSALEARPHALPRPLEHTPTNKN